jgi:Spy/CpxP family protein refolding chaperone
MAAPAARPSGPSTTAHSGLQFGPAGRWWDDKTVVQAVGIRKAQQKQMDAAFNANKPAILASYKAFLSEQAKLDKISKDPNVDQARLFAAIDAVNQARASLQKATSQMLLQIRQQMDPGQIAKLEKLK